MMQRRVPAGLTIVELVIVIVLIGIIAAIGIPAIARSTGRANVTVVKGDLQKLVAAQEAYFYTHASYAPSAAALNVAPSPGVTLTVVEATANGWSATAAQAAGVPVTCALFYGSAAPVAPARAAGQVGCK